ncbi:MAG: glycosyltransferase [Bacteroidales bacterium]|nr:glycosyltransferase [Bacteroidales bacterium]
MSSDAPQISLIVPYHNAAATLERCVSSIMRQDCQGLEVIFVNDASTDNSERVVLETLAKYPNPAIQTRNVVLPLNLGCAGANGKGLQHAQGEYVARLDADDELAPNALSRLLEHARATHADIVAAAHIRVEPNGKRKTGSPQSPLDINHLRMDVTNYSLWNKLIRRSLLINNQIAPVEGIDCWEDVVVTAPAMAVANKVELLPDSLYIYYQMKGSLSRAAREKLLNHHLKAALMLEQWFTARGLEQQFKPFLDRLKLIAKVKYLRGKNKDVGAWLRTFPEVNSRVMCISQVPLHYRLMFKAVASLPESLTQRIADFCDRFYK